MKTFGLRTTLSLSALAVASSAAAGGLVFDPPAIDIHGFGSVGYIVSSGNEKWPGTEDGTLEFNEFGLNFTTQLTEKVRAGAQLFSRDLSDFGNNKIALDWAYVDYRHQDWLGVQLGKTKLPRGLYNETRDVDLLRTSIFMPSSVYSQNSRDYLLSSKGGAVYGSAGMGQLGYLDYRATYGTSDVATDGASIEYLESQGVIANAHNAEIDKIGAASLVWSTPIEGLRFGVSHLRVNQFALDGRIGQFWAMFGSMYGLQLDPAAPGSFYAEDYKEFILSAEYVWDRLLVAYEYQQASFNGVASFLDLEESAITPQGYYLSASYRVSDAFSVGLTRDISHTGIGERGLPGSYQKSYVLSLRYDITPQWLIKGEHHLIEGYGEASVGLLGTGEQNWTLSAIKTTYSF